jgi:hypothetical protein
MFARTVSLQLKPNSVAEFTHTIEKDIIPLLHKQPGFQDEIAFVVPDGTEEVSVSIWDHKRVRDSLSPQHLSSRAENLGEGGGGHAAGAHPGAHL